MATMGVIRVKGLNYKSKFYSLALRPSKHYVTLLMYAPHAREYTLTVLASRDTRRAHLPSVVFDNSFFDVSYCRLLFCIIKADYFLVRVATSI